eukprot:scaffold14920_cov95-Isochrysis_galbana.AAC.3
MRAGALKTGVVVLEPWVHRHAAAVASWREVRFSVHVCQSNQGMGVGEGTGNTHAGRELVARLPAGRMRACDDASSPPERSQPREFAVSREENGSGQAIGTGNHEPRG